VLYQIATGRAPFQGADNDAIRNAVLDHQPSSPREINPDVPPALSDLVIKLLAKEAGQRFQSAAEVIDALEALPVPSPLTDPAGDPAAPPVLELTLSHIAGNPWQGKASVRFGGRVSPWFDVSEGLTAKERQEIRWYVEEFMDLPEGGNRVRADSAEKLLRAHGQALWRQLQRPEVEAWLAAAQQRGEGRLVLRAEKPADEVAFRTPWELLRAGAEPGTPLHALSISVVRRVQTTLPPVQALDVSGGLRVLAIVCRPDDAGFLDPRYTPETILDALKARPEVSVEFCRPATLSALVRTLEEARDAGRPYHVVHFDGHGTTIEGGLGALCFENDEGRLDLVRADQLGHLLAGRHIPLVVLAACRTATRVSAEETVAGELLRQGVGTVVAMGHAVHVDMDRELIAGFYESIARGRSLGAALQSARKRVAAQPRRRLGMGPDAPLVELQDWFVPQLYQAGDDPVLLSQKPRKRKPREQPLFARFPQAPRAGFQGRGRELHRLERALLKHRAVVLHGTGGIGKTGLAREAALWWTRTGMFPDGAVFVSFEDAPSPEAVIARVGEALEGVDFHKRKKPAAWLARELGKRRRLLVWDNYESVLPAFRGGEATPPELAELARTWTAGKTRLLVTCRDSETGLEAWPFALGELSVPEGLLLLVRLLERLGIDPVQRTASGLTAAALRVVVERTGGHPLALELVAPFLRQRGPEAVAAELGELRAQAEQQHQEGRNRNIWASLHFSIRHLSPAAQAALPAVAMLAGGCLENMAPAVAGLDEQAWASIRTELERTGLVRVEGGVLRPHPVLGDVRELAPTPEQEKRFLDVVLGLCAVFDKKVRSSDSRAALQAMGSCEAVVRRAVDRVLLSGDLRAAWEMAESLRQYLDYSGRTGEGTRLMTRLRERAQASTGDLTELAAQLELSAGEEIQATNPETAQQRLEELLQRLEAVRSWDTREARAFTLMALGRIHYDVRRRPADALGPLEHAARLYRELESEGRIDATNRAAVLGDRANALRRLGRFEEALAAAEEALACDRERNDGPAVARDLGRIAQVFKDQGRYQEAEERYRQARDAARSAGDVKLLGILSEHLGSLALNRSHPEEALPLFREALAAFQQARDGRGQLNVLNFLGILERQRGNLDAARAWYERSSNSKISPTWRGKQRRAPTWPMRFRTKGNRLLMLMLLVSYSREPSSRTGLPWP
jgi:tetratricopeptide (TPR) repeat protein